MGCRCRGDAGVAGVMMRRHQFDDPRLPIVLGEVDVCRWVWSAAGVMHALRARAAFCRALVYGALRSVMVDYTAPESGSRTAKAAMVLRFGPGKSSSSIC